MDSRPLVGTNSQPAQREISSGDAKKAKKRERANAWYAKHRDEVLDKRAKEYQATLQYVADEEERRQLLADPRRAIRQDTVVCMGANVEGECWQALRGMLNNSHLKQHGIIAREYKRIHGYSQSTPLVSEKMQAKLSARRRGESHALANRGREALKPYQVSGRTRVGLKSLEARLDASDRMRGVARPDLTAVPSTEIVARWLFGNKTTDQIASETLLTKDEVHLRLRRIFGLHPRGDMRRVHGEIVSDVWLGELLRSFGDIYKSQAAIPMGVPSSRLYSISKRRKSLALTAKSAERLIRLEREMLTLLFRDQGKQPQHFRAVAPDLAKKLEAARVGIALLRPLMGQQEQLNRIIEDLCAKSQLAMAKGEQSQARMTLLWMPEILAWMERNPAKLHRKPNAIALEFVADDYRTKPWVVQRALSGAGGHATELGVIHSIISTSFRALPVKRAVGRPREQATKWRIEAIAAISILGAKQKEFAQYIFTDQPASADESLRRFKNKYKSRIERCRTKITPEKAQVVLNSLIAQPQP